MALNSQQRGNDENIASAVAYLCLALGIICLVAVSNSLILVGLCFAVSLIASIYLVVRGSKRKQSLAIFLDDLNWFESIFVSIPLFLLAAVVTGLMVVLIGLPTSGPGSQTVKTVGTIIVFALAGAAWMAIAIAADRARSRIYGDIKPINPVTRFNFQEEVARGVTLVDCWASWCSPCLEQAAILHNYRKDKIKVVSVDVEKEEVLSNQLAVRSLPTLMVFIDGQEIDREVGVSDIDKIDQLIERSRRAKSSGKTS